RHPLAHMEQKKQRPCLMDITYVLPLRTSHPMSLDFDEYLDWLSRRVELIVVDGSDDEIQRAHAHRWEGMGLQHAGVDPDVRRMLNGKVAGVLTGVRRA